MGGPHDICAGVLSATHQVPCRFLFNTGDGDLDDLAKLEQPGQMQSITGIFSELEVRLF